MNNNEQKTVFYRFFRTRAIFYSQNSIVHRAFEDLYMHYDQLFVDSIESNYMSSWLKRDPIEDDPKYRKILAAADKKAEKETKNSKGQMGHCHAFWGAKQRILAKKGIDWKSPAELNPYCKFD